MLKVQTYKLIKVLLQCLIFYLQFASMIYTLGQPPDHLLNNGLHTSRYFTYTESKMWEIKVKPKDASLTSLRLHNFIT